MNEHYRGWRVMSARIRCLREQLFLTASDPKNSDKKWPRIEGHLGVGGAFSGEVRSAEATSKARKGLSVDNVGMQYRWRMIED